MSERTQIFDFDNHYYEADDAFTRHQDRTMRNRGVRWAEIDGRRTPARRRDAELLHRQSDLRPGGQAGVARGTGTAEIPAQQNIVEAFGELEPIRPEYRDRDARLGVMDDQDIEATLLFPTLGVGVEEALRDDPEAAAASFRAFNRWLDEDWGFSYEGRIFAVPYIPMLDPGRRRRGTADRARSWRDRGQRPQCPRAGRRADTDPRSTRSTTRSGVSPPSRG